MFDWSFRVQCRYYISQSKQTLVDANRFLKANAFRFRFVLALSVCKVYQMKLGAYEIGAAGSL
jgi:hypothetical protein